MRKISIRISVTALFLVMAFMTQGFGQGLIHNVKGREYVSLNGHWNYIIDPYQMGYLDYRRKPFDERPDRKGGFYDNLTNLPKDRKAEYDFSFEPTMLIPGDWNSQDERLRFYEGTVWFKKDFVLHQKEGKRYFLHFGAVNYEANVYVNGKKAGVHRGGFTPFQYDVTELVNEGDNFVVVMADNTRKPNAIPTDNTDWWNYGGITREVLLLEVPESYILDYKVQLDKNDRELLKGYIQLDGKNRQQKVSLDIPELKLKKTFETDMSGRCEFSLPVKHVQYWSPEAPYLYTVNISSASDNITDRIGFRTVNTEGKDIYLNGRSVFLRGISIHDENPLTEGRFRSEGGMRMVLQWAKELGCNYVRLAHYTHNETMLRLADEIGLLVWAEIPVYWTISWENEATYRNAEHQLATAIERDKNRAGVIIWSVGNETPVTAARNDFMARLVEKTRNLDNTRLVAAALEVERDGYTVIVEDPLGEKLDLASFNEYGGWYWGKTEELPKYRFDIRYDKPVIISEFGAGALGGFHGDIQTIWTEEYQEDLYKKQLEMLDKIEGLRGMTPWILVDFKSPRRQHPVFQDFWNRKGLLTPNGEKKKAFHVLRKYYAEKSAEFTAK
ncbi:beta-glucuronidase [Sinomicrobium kalidii]|uniref:glycoside hydrolase family 2 protein n=1 Tax=Sinomicrobium kalidii TaxID=2900738 RepID=UPI001E45B6FE|nr:glycoside hydrolase family 2 TIM barrel-domain containing protein [Sinomicrobium kalidii]UGU15866.1 beta-glucuronidase [Sinomicrobium kalidii]